MNRTRCRLSDAVHSNDTSSHGDTVSRRIPQVANMLKAAKVVCVQLKYDGQFDYGVLADPVSLLSDGAPVILGVPGAPHSELRVFFSELLDLRFPQWANVEGARAEFQWDLIGDVLAHAQLSCLLLGQRHELPPRGAPSHGVTRRPSPSPDETLQQF
jgi:hypothetical protein